MTKKSIITPEEMEKHYDNGNPIPVKQVTLNQQKKGKDGVERYIGESSSAPPMRESKSKQYREKNLSRYEYLAEMMRNPLGINRSDGSIESYHDKNLIRKQIGRR